jgi:septation ring formation regulator EzrA
MPSEMDSRLKAQIDDLSEQIQFRMQQVRDYFERMEREVTVLRDEVYRLYDLFKGDKFR